MRIQNILRTKGREVVTVDPDRTVLDAVQVLVERNIGSVVVVDADDRVLGILTERDVLRLTAARPDALGGVTVSEVMTRDLHTATPDDTVGHAMQLMTEKRVRHLPILERGALAGMVSIGDLVNHVRLAVQHENEHLKQYIHGMQY